LTIDRATVQAALITLALAWPVHQGVDFVLRPVLERLPWLAAPPSSSLPPVAAAPAPRIEVAALAPVAEPAPPLPAARVDGTLRTGDGTPVPGETVVLESGALGARYFATSDARGRFAIPDVRLGFDYEVRVPTEGRYGALVRSGVNVPPEGATLELVLEPIARARLAGRMVDVDGVAIPQRTLLLEASHVPGLMLHITGDDRGYFRVDEAPTGRLTFTTRSIPHLKVRGPLLSPDEDADLRVVLDEGEYELGGRVVGDHGAPVVGAQLKLSWSHKEAGSISSSSRTAVTGGLGDFRFFDLGRGSHELVVRAAGYHDARETVDVFWNAGYVELRLRPRP
jgi:hypothetical protein